MGALIIWIGVGVAAIGIVLTTNGLVIYQSTFGNAMATVGGIALVGGLIIVALGFIYRVLLQISEKLDGAMLPLEAEDYDEEPAAAPVPATVSRSVRPETPVFTPTVEAARRETLSQPAPTVAASESVAPSRGTGQSVDARASSELRLPPGKGGRFSEAAPAGAPADITPRSRATPAGPVPAAAAMDAGALPSWFRRGRDAGPSTAPTPPAAPPATRNAPFERDAEDDDRPIERSSQPVTRAPLPHFEEDDGREDFPVVVRSGPQNYGLEPQEGVEASDYEPLVPRRDVAFDGDHREAEEFEAPARELRDAPDDIDPGAPPAFIHPPEPESPAAPAAGPVPIPRAPRAPTVLKSGFIGGMAYTLYSDGSIEAELPDGLLRFASLQDLREHVSGGGKTE